MGWLKNRAERKEAINQLNEYLIALQQGDITYEGKAIDLIDKYKLRWAGPALEKAVEACDGVVKAKKILSNYETIIMHGGIDLYTDALNFAVENNLSGDGLDAAMSVAVPIWYEVLNEGVGYYAGIGAPTTQQRTALDYLLRVRNIFESENRIFLSDIEMDSVKYALAKKKDPDITT
jgi:hypothetical protein